MTFNDSKAAISPGDGPVAVTRLQPLGGLSLSDPTIR